MTIVLRITVAVLCIAFSVFAVRLISSGRMLLRYSLLWFAIVVIALLCAIFPEPLFSLSSLLGFNTASNFVLFMGILLAFALSLTLTVAISRLSRDVTSLVQENAVLRHKIERMNGTLELDGDAAKKIGPMPVEPDETA